MRLLAPMEGHIGDKIQFKISKGLPQGLAISTTLFIAYLDWALKESSISTDNLLAYANDLVFICQNKLELDLTFEKLDTLKCFLSVNTKKSGILPIFPNQLKRSPSFDS